MPVYFFNKSEVPVAQSVERWSYEPKVVGSSPTRNI